MQEQVVAAAALAKPVVQVQVVQVMEELRRMVVARGTAVVQIVDQGLPSQFQEKSEMRNLIEGASSLRTRCLIAKDLHIQVLPLATLRFQLDLGQFLKITGNRSMMRANLLINLI